MKSYFLNKKKCAPNFLCMHAVGVNIGNHSIRYIEFLDKKGKISLKNYGEILIPPGVFKDGEILNKDVLVKLLVGLKEKISSNTIKVCIPEDKNYIFNIRIPKVPEKEIRQVLEFKIEENVPLSSGEALFEYEIIEQESDSKELFLNVSVIPKKIVSEYSELFNLAGLYPVSFEAESRMTALSIIPRDQKDTFMIMNIKDSSTVFSVVSRGVVCLTTTVLVGNYSIMESLSKSLNYGDKKLEKLPDEFFYSNKAYSIDNFNSLLNILSILKDELEKFNSYWSKQDDQVKKDFPVEINKIFVCGRSAALPGFVEHITQNSHIQAVLSNVWENSFKLEETLPDIKFVDSLDYAIPIGLALSSYKK